MSATRQKLKNGREKRRSSVSFFICSKQMSLQSTIATNDLEYESGNNILKSMKIHKCLVDERMK